MNKPLTKAQKRVIAAILDLSRKTGQSPTMEELRQALGLSSISSVQRHIDALRKEGAVKNEKHQPPFEQRGAPPHIGETLERGHLWVLRRGKGRLSHALRCV